MKLDEAGLGRCEMAPPRIELSPESGVIRSNERSGSDTGHWQQRYSHDGAKRFPKRCHAVEGKSILKNIKR